MPETAEPCPYCGEPTKRLPDHLPCEGVPELDTYNA